MRGDVTAAAAVSFWDRFLVLASSPIPVDRIALPGDACARI
jgi:hypothetical protein